MTEEPMVCRACKATISQMESDVAALGGLFAQAVARLQDHLLKLLDEGVKIVVE